MNSAALPSGSGQSVYVVDDDSSVLRAVSRLLRAAGYAVTAFSCPLEFFGQFDRNAPGCVVLDIAMPGLDGLELQRRLNGAATALAVVFVTGHGDVPASVRAMKAGAVDFLTKPFNDTDLLDAVDSALRRSRAAFRSRDELAVLYRRLASLTLREREVFEHVVAGQLNKLIAVDLGAAEKTIKVHRGRVMQKMEAGSLADLVRMAERMGIHSTQRNVHP
ncbi:MAG TPA: response regulator [Burkholderiales bacterium]|nr:response regulator [Burkholderiales bacterium]